MWHATGVADKTTTNDDKSSVVAPELLKLLTNCNRYQIVYLVLDQPNEYMCVSKVRLIYYNPDAQELIISNSDNTINASKYQYGTLFLTSVLRDYPNNQRGCWAHVCANCYDTSRSSYSITDSRISTVQLDITDSFYINRFKSFAIFDYYGITHVVLHYKFMNDSLFHPIFTRRRDRLLLRTSEPLAIETSEPIVVDIQTSEPLAIDIPLVKPPRTRSKCSQAELIQSESVSSPTVNTPTIIDSLSSMYSKFISAFSESFSTSIIDSDQSFMP